MRVEKSGVYKIACGLTGKFYIGSSKQIYRRWYQHRLSLRRGNSSCRYLQNAWTRYGEGAFMFSILEECDKELLERREQFFINTLKPKYNLVINVKQRSGPKVQEKRTASLRARAALITHCPHGHLYDEANTYYGRNGGKICRKCNAERVIAILARETEEERIIRLAKLKASHEANREARLAKQKEYAKAHKEEKRLYDQLHREEAARRKREAKNKETPEQRQLRLARKMASYYHCKERNKNATDLALSMVS